MQNYCDLLMFDILHLYSRTTLYVYYISVFYNNSLTLRATSIQFNLWKAARNWPANAERYNLKLCTSSGLLGSFIMTCKPGFVKPKVLLLSVCVFQDWLLYHLIFVNPRICGRKRKVKSDNKLKGLNLQPSSKCVRCPLIYLNCF
jgi:hypothetical protein